jgi:hypothetical protein
MGKESIGDYLNQFIMSNDASVIRNENNSFVYSLDSSNAKEAISYVNALVNEHKVIFDNLNEQQQGNLSQSTNQYVFNLTSIPDFSSVDGVEYGTVFFPKGPAADKYTVSYKSNNYYAIPQSAKSKHELSHLLYDLIVAWNPNMEGYIPYSDYADYLADKYEIHDNNIIPYLLEFDNKSISCTNMYVVPAKIYASLLYTVYDGIIVDQLSIYDYFEKNRDAAQKYIIDEMSKTYYK